MLTTSSHTNYSYARRIMVLPLLTITVLFFAFRFKNDASKSNASIANSPFVLVVDAGHGGTNTGAPGINNELEKDITLSIANKILQLAPAYDITVKMTRTNDATLTPQNRIDFIEQQKPDACISIHINNSPGQTKSNEISAYITSNNMVKTFQQSRMLGSGLLQNMTKDFAVNTILQQRKNHGIYILDNNIYPTVLLECGYMNNPESVKLLMTDAGIEKIARDILEGVAAFANADKKDLQNAAGALSKEDTSLPDTTGKKAPLYLVDNKETSVKDAEAINTNTIQSVKVIKGDEAAVRIYGAKAANGVVLITLKTPANTEIKDVLDSNNTAPLTVKTKLDSALIIWDGKIINSKQFSLMNTNDLESVSILKDEEAVEKYGEKGKNGVILITSKKQSSSSFNPDSNYTIKPSDAIESKAAIYVDGKKISKKEMDKIPADNIESISVWKDGDAIKKYGDKGKNGVIEITLKK